MDFRHPIVTCLFSMLRLSFETQKVKENYAIFFKKVPVVFVGLANDTDVENRENRMRRIIIKKGW